ncbi:hypothetical protein SUGI_0995120 [Cryptomeria japonica]|nr:hypothetical protein SUGI_0995120 [Cryptomeria japonica]
MPSAVVNHATLTFVVGDHEIPFAELSSAVVGLHSATDARISSTLAVDSSIARVDSTTRVGASATGPAIAGFAESGDGRGIDYNVSIFSIQGVICRFRGFWLSLPQLHSWISEEQREPLITGGQIHADD